MSWFYRHVVRPVLFTQESESAHNRTLAALALASRSRSVGRCVAAFARVPNLPVQTMGLRFPNPVGLAAGMDKRAVALPMWRALGFGFSELGGVTWHAQPGNPAPRMFRVIQEEALINRMGFNNSGAAAMVVQLQDWRRRGDWPDHPVGINLGKSKVTPLAEAATDYGLSLEALWPLGDFFVVNVSSPNTPNLRQLQDRTALDDILAALQERNCRAGIPKPLLVKVAPDLSFEALDEIVEVALRRNLAGIVATNTTITRPKSNNPRTMKLYEETGGLSGRPLRERSTEVVRHLYRQSQGKLVLVGVGGVASAADAWEKVTAGASLVQIYSGLVFQGPFLVREIVRGLRERLAGAPWEDAVGSEARQ
ncbi:MAG TPA: quinone-dependent dihydroorotate dehydrogenase [Verrucomicrobiota bacterium]|nr:dihydroorotate dehydrogenase (quinone) [Verrucomicrobiales bacterium]HRI12924.1 quinone-dependent dihydroorotate dehydrogenase [Verrucomicrobiota bacterium]